MVGYLLFSLSEKVGFQFGQSSSIINQMLSQLTAVGKYIPPSVFTRMALNETLKS